MSWCVNCTSGSTKSLHPTFAQIIGAPNRLNAACARIGYSVIVDEAAILLRKMHPKTLMRLARNGEVPAIKIGRTWFSCHGLGGNECHKLRCDHPGRERCERQVEGVREENGREIC